jgi:hypothetical protein
VHVSPKLAHSGVRQRARIRLDVLDEFAALQSAAFKFVAQSPSDLDEIAGLLNDLSVPVAPERVFIMAQATASGPLLAKSRESVDAVVVRGWALTPRWHILLWDYQRGRCSASGHPAPQRFRCTVSTTSFIFRCAPRRCGSHLDGYFGLKRMYL